MLSSWKFVKRYAFKMSFRRWKWKFSRLSGFGMKYFWRHAKTVNIYIFIRIYIFSLARKCGPSFSHKLKSLIFLIEGEQTETLAYLSSDKSQNTHSLFFPAAWKEKHWINWFQLFFQETRNHKVKKQTQKEAKFCWYLYVFEYQSDVLH